MASFSNDLELENKVTTDAIVTKTDFPPFECGYKFSTYMEVEEAKDMYEKKYFSILSKTRSEKFHEGHKNRETLFFKSVTFECKKGQRRKPSISVGIRPNVKTGKLGCNFKVKVNAKGGFLVVKESNLEHSKHELTEERFLHLPENLRLTSEEQKEVELCIKSGGNKKKIQAHLIQQRKGKPVILKTLHNIGTKLRKIEESTGQTDLEKLVTSMAAIPDAIVNVAYEEETKELLGVYFQDSRMKALFKKFPELIIFDATYKLNNYKLPLFVLLIVDGNGESEIVALFIIQSESKLCVGTMLNFFKEHNEDWSNVEVLLGDKDFADRAVFKEKFPAAKLQVCLFHALRTFKREVPSKLGKVNRCRKNQVLKIFTDLAYSESEESYNISHSKLVSLNIEDLTTYYENNWHSIKEEWVMYEQNRNFIINNRTTNRLESLNQKLKTVISRYSALGNFFRDLIVSVMPQNVERDHRAIQMLEKAPVIANLDDVETNINRHLTQFAANYVCKEYRESFNITSSSSNDGIYIFPKKSFEIQATESSCTCGFSSSMGLACRHVMAVRREKNMPIYDHSLSRARWTRPYYASAHPVFQKPAAIGNFEIAPRTECEKYGEVKKITSNINSIISTLSNDRYEYYVEKLKIFQSQLANDEPINITIDDPPTNQDVPPLTESSTFDMSPSLTPDILTHSPSAVPDHAVGRLSESSTYVHPPSSLAPPDVPGHAVGRLPESSTYVHPPSSAPPVSTVATVVVVRPLPGPGIPEPTIPSLASRRKDRGRKRPSKKNQQKICTKKCRFST